MTVLVLIGIPIIERLLNSRAVKNMLILLFDMVVNLLKLQMGVTLTKLAHKIPYGQQGAERNHYFNRLSLVNPVV
jgi:hypothetical protein